ncbi:hypothetical protein M1O55_00460 [Dehalococcoidia bacterium]|nr:hypothetical protein [Dehalococcoidia bacterium]|tara:strand:+ start:764 stop:1135 length:372 start_codon:yes stop_codon:yes gene_type:complete
MRSAIQKQVEICISQLKHGTLTESELRGISDAASQVRPVQDVLYLHTNVNSLTSPVLAMRILEGGEISDGPEDPDDWPYQSVQEAIQDGWRVLKFPELALMMDESRTYGLGFEFILERDGVLA